MFNCSSDSADETDRGDSHPPSAGQVLTHEGLQSLQTTPLVSESPSPLLVQTPPSTAEESPVPVMEVDNRRQPFSDSGHELLVLKGKHSSLELENNLLKQEVQSLTDELGSVMKRMRDSSEGKLSCCTGQM